MSLRTITFLGIGFSAICIAIVVGVLYFKWSSVAGMPLGTWGDFLSGVIAPIALIWLVVGYFQQGIELRQNTKALELQAEQLRLQVAETHALTVEAKAQSAASLAMVKHQQDIARRERARVAPTLGEMQANVDNQYAIVAFKNVGEDLAMLHVDEVTPPSAKADIQPAGLMKKDTNGKVVIVFPAGVPPKYQFNLICLDRNRELRKLMIYIDGGSTAYMEVTEPVA